MSNKEFLRTLIFYKFFPFIGKLIEKIIDAFLKNSKIKEVDGKMCYSYNA